MPADPLNTQAEALADARRERDAYKDALTDLAHIARGEMGDWWPADEPRLDDVAGRAYAAVCDLVRERDALRAEVEAIAAVLDGGQVWKMQDGVAIPAVRRVQIALLQRNARKAERDDLQARLTREAATHAAREGELSRLVADLQGQLMDADATAAGLRGRLAEAEATLANERGEGDPPEPGWQCVSSTIWNIGCGGQPGYASVSRGTERGCPWHWYAGGFEGVETTARAAMRAASERLRGSS